MHPAKEAAADATILLVDGEVLVRTAIAEYLRGCGYRVIEAAQADEAVAVLNDDAIPVGIVLSALELQPGMDGFGLARWIREHRPGVSLVLAGTPARAVASATELCENGPMLARPYDPQSVHDRIKRLLAVRKPRPE